MALPEFNEFGNLSEGIHAASLAEVLVRFGSGSLQRERVAARFQRIVDLAISTGGFDRLILFGSFVTNKVEPNDVDVILVMRDDFQIASCSQDALALFNHQRASNELGASIFWIRPELLLGEPIDQFIAHWQITREGLRRGIVEVRV